MNEDEARDVEERLKEIQVKPAPPGLRRRVLDAAAKHKEGSAWTTPLLRWCLAACAAVILVVFLADGFISRSQTHRLEALLDGSRPATSWTDDGSRALAEVLGEPVAGKLLARSETAAELREKGEPLRREEILKELLTEDFDGSESKKDTR